MFTFISSFNKEEILKFNKNTGIIFRNYEKKTNRIELLEIKKFCKKHKMKLYLANNLKLAISLGLDGVYIPSFNKNFRVQKYNLRKNFLILGSAHNFIEIKEKEKQGVDIIFLSPLFKTKHYKKGHGVIKFNFITRISAKKIIALGGINKSNFNYLKITNACGFSGISYFKNE